METETKTKTVVHKSKFFTAREIAPKTVMITGLGMENCFLLEGSGHALLIDTLTGAGNLKAFCRELTDLPVTVVNTHGHADHCGGNFDFDGCYIHPDDVSLMYEHVTVEHRMRFVKGSMAKSGADVKLTPDDFHPPEPAVTRPVYDGNVFELGGRRLEVIGVPGHSFGTIVLLERKLGVVFSGDACNANTLLFLGGSASVEEYLAGLTHFKGFTDAFDKMYGGHGLIPVPVGIVDEAIELCHEIMEGKDDAAAGSAAGSFYGKRKNDSYQRDDGKIANIAYSRDNIKTPLRDGVISLG